MQEQFLPDNKLWLCSIPLGPMFTLNLTLYTPCIKKTKHQHNFNLYQQFFMLLLLIVPYTFVLLKVTKTRTSPWLGVLSLTWEICECLLWHHNGWFPELQALAHAFWKGEQTKEMSFSHFSGAHWQPTDMSLSGNIGKVNFAWSATFVTPIVERNQILLHAMLALSLQKKKKKKSCTSFGSFFKEQVKVPAAVNRNCSRYPARCLDVWQSDWFICSTDYEPDDGNTTGGCPAVPWRPARCQITYNGHPHIQSHLIHPAPRRSESSGSAGPLWPRRQGSARVYSHDLYLQYM